MVKAWILKVSLLATHKICNNFVPKKPHCVTLLCSCHEPVMGQQNGDTDKNNCSSCNS